MLNYIRFLCSPSFYKSFKFLVYLNTSKSTDVFFYYPQHFNSKGDYPFSLINLINSIKNNTSLSYKVVEEPNIFSRSKRNINSAPFDFLWLMVIVLRKIYKGNNYNIIDVKIGSLLSKIFFIRRDVKCIITISQSFQSVFKGMFPKAHLMDYQHGLISSQYYGYMNNDTISEQVLINNTRVLLYGDFFKEKLINIKGGDYFKKQSNVIGCPYTAYKKPLKKFNGNILFSLQFTKSHSNELNSFFLEETIKLFESIKRENLNLKLFLKLHPRHEDCINLDKLFEYDFVKLAPKELSKCFEICSLHITEYSSVVFDALIHGIPTLLSRFSSVLNILENEFNFPKRNSNIINDLSNLSKDDFYKKLIQQQTNWSNKLYSPFDEKEFLKLIQG